MKIPQGGEPQGAYLGSPIFIVKDPSLGHLCQETFWYLQQSLNLRGGVTKKKRENLGKIPN